MIPPPSGSTNRRAFASCQPREVSASSGGNRIELLQVGIDCAQMGFHLDSQRRAGFDEALDIDFLGRRGHEFGGVRLRRGGWNFGCPGGCRGTGCRRAPGWSSVPDGGTELDTP